MLKQSRRLLRRHIDYREGMLFAARMFLTTVLWLNYGWVLQRAANLATALSKRPARRAAALARSAWGETTPSSGQAKVAVDQGDDSSRPRIEQLVTAVSGRANRASDDSRGDRAEIRRGDRFRRALVAARNGDTKGSGRC